MRSKQMTGAIIRAWGVYKMWLDTEDKEKTNDEIIADALARILYNQIEIKKRLGLAFDDDCYGECYYDYQAIEELAEVQ